MQLIGVLGGTFDPVHNGHLRLAIESQEQISLAEVRLIPNDTPNHRAKANADNDTRLSMLAAAVESPRLIIDSREIDRPGVSYMVDTLSSLKAEFPDDALCLIIGIDAYLGLPQWDRWESLFELSHLLVATRPGVEIAPSAVLESATSARVVSNSASLLSSPHGQIYFMNIPLLEISASDIRARCRAGLDISYLVPSSVQHIIERKRLYIG